MYLREEPVKDTPLMKDFRVQILPVVRIEPVTVGWEARRLPLRYAVPPSTIQHLPTSKPLLTKLIKCRDARFFLLHFILILAARRTIK